MDLIFIKQLKVMSIIGAYDWEQLAAQPLLLDLELGYDLQAAANHDDLHQAIDYTEIVQVVTSHLQNNKFALLERAAVSTANVLMQQFAIFWIKLTINKPNAIKEAQAVGVSIERGTI